MLNNDLATTDTNLEIKISGVPDYSSESDTKFADVMQHEFRESRRVLTFLGEDENGITNIDVWENSIELHRDRDQY